MCLCLENCVKKLHLIYCFNTFSTVFSLSLCMYIYLYISIYISHIYLCFFTFVKIPLKSSAKCSAFKVILCPLLAHPVLLFTLVLCCTFTVFSPAGTYFLLFLKQAHKSSHFSFSFPWNRFLDHKKPNL